MLNKNIKNILRGGVRWEFRTNIDFHAGSVADELDEPIPLEYLRLEPVLGSLVSTSVRFLIRRSWTRGLTIILRDGLYP